jgi:hypothetical protein
MTKDKISLARNEIVRRVKGKLAVSLVQTHPALAAYVVGRSALRSVSSPKDLDILLVDISSANPTKTRELKTLAEAMATGNPFEAAFDGTDSHLRDILNHSIAEASVASPRIIVRISFAFGPTTNEIGIPSNGLHVHFAGPLTAADLRTIRNALPFHAADFAAHHRVIIGPPLRTILPASAPSLRELGSWDRLLLRRFHQANDLEGQRKWIRRMLRNRRLVPEYWRAHKKLITHLEHVVQTAMASDFESIVSVLLESMTIFAVTTKPRVKGRPPLS